MRRTRNGFTLMEVVLVMAILVIVGAVAVTSIPFLLGNGNLEAAMDTVQAEMVKARNKAKEEGRAYKFAVKANGTYRIAPDGDDFWSGNAGSVAGGPLEGGVVEGKLPEKVCFSTPNGLGNSSSDWSIIATFLADGTAVEDVQVGISLEGSNPHLINLKAATGSITTAPPVAGQ